eukprot:CCRYP_005135-RA/>CCRYP_005135-RA protein AED:0.47 eAED:0.48 QI:0/0/0/1/0/0/2/0/95
MTLNTVRQQAFNNLKATITRYVTSVYHDFSQDFEIYTDSSKLQSGAAAGIFQYRKLTPMQQKHTMTKQELLARVETLKEFKGTLWGQQTAIDSLY